MLPLALGEADSEPAKGGAPPEHRRWVSDGIGPFSRTSTERTDMAQYAEAGTLAQ